MCAKSMKAEKVFYSVYADTRSDGSSNLGAIAVASFVVAVDASSSVQNRMDTTGTRKV